MYSLNGYLFAPLPRCINILSYMRKQTSVLQHLAVAKGSFSDSVTQRTKQQLLQLICCYSCTSTRDELTFALRNHRTADLQRSGGCFPSLSLVHRHGLTTPRSGKYKQKTSLDDRKQNTWQEKASVHLWNKQLMWLRLANIQPV